MYRQLKEYVWKVRWSMVAVAVITLITHGSMLFSRRFGLDTEYMMDGLSNFDTDGRQGLLWLGKLFWPDQYNLYHAEALTVLFMALTPVALGFVLYCQSRQERFANLTLLVLALSFVISPFWVAQVYFLNQSAQVLFACLLLAAALLCADRARGHAHQKWYLLVIAVALLQLILACYQVLALLYILSVVALFLLSSLKEERSFRDQMRWIGFHAGIFLAGVIVYLTVSALFFMSEGSYLSNQIAWGSQDAVDILHHCLTAVSSSLKTRPPYYTGFYGFFCLMLLFLTADRFCRSGKCKTLSFWVILLAELVLIGAPYLFIFVFGGEIADRMQLAMPLSQGFILYLTVLLLEERQAALKHCRRLLTQGLALLTALILLQDTGMRLENCNRLYYTEEWVFQYDLAMAEKLHADILDTKAASGLDASYPRLIFLGYPTLPYNKLCIRGAEIGHSTFQAGTEAIRRMRVLSFMRNVGYPLEIYLGENEQAAFFAYFEEYFGSRVDAMPSYPAPGYVQYLTDEIGLDYIVIKLGNDWRLIERYQ